MQHANSPLTPNGRLRMVRLVEEQGFTFEAAAAASNVAKSTCWEWGATLAGCRRERAARSELLEGSLLAAGPQPQPGSRRRGAADLRAPSAHRLEPDAAR